MKFAVYISAVGALPCAWDGTETTTGTGSAAVLSCVNKAWSATAVCVMATANNGCWML